MTSSVTTAPSVTSLRLRCAISQEGIKAFTTRVHYEGKTSTVRYYTSATVKMARVCEALVRKEVFPSSFFCAATFHIFLTSFLLSPPVNNIVHPNLNSTSVSVNLLVCAYLYK